jgi:hypothetical protein
VLTAAAVAGILSRVPARWRAFGLAAVAMLSIFFVREAIDRQAFELRDFERRFRTAGDYVAAHLPQNAVVVTAHESGSIRFYSRRLTVSWREFPPRELARVLDFLRAQGYRPYLLLEMWEQPEFVQRFEATSPLGGLGWPPMADIDHKVRIFDVDDYARYRSGIPVRTDRIWNLRRDQISIFHHDKTEGKK